MGEDGDVKSPLHGAPRQTRPHLTRVGSRQEAIPFPAWRPLQNR